MASWGQVGKVKVVTLVGTRPEIIKLSRVMAALDRHANHVVAHSGQNYDYELNEVFFEELGIRPPDHFLDAVGSTAIETISSVILKVDHLLEQEKPDAFLVYGDTNTCLGTIAAKRRKIPIFHMEAGNRCFDQRVPEELNRKIVDHVSDVNMTNSEHARRYLLAEGLRPDLVIKTGSPMKEVLAHNQAAIARSDVLQRLGVQPGEYIVVSAHREETVDIIEKLTQLVDALASMAHRYRKRVIVSTHPRTRRRLSDHGAAAQLGDQNDITFCKPFGYLDYVKLQQEAFCVVSDSGTLTEEASVLGFPAVMIREAHERPEGTDVGVTIFAGLRPGRILQAIDAVTVGKGERPHVRAPDYDIDDVSSTVVRTVISYVDYVKRTVWSQRLGESPP